MSIETKKKKDATASALKRFVMRHEYLFVGKLGLYLSTRTYRNLPEAIGKMTNGGHRHYRQLFWRFYWEAE
jgi:hypothetical protein